VSIKHYKLSLDVKYSMRNPLCDALAAKLHQLLFEAGI